MYETIYNFIEAKNNDGPCPYNKATYSSELCEKLLKLYPPSNGVVYDPFMGSGTTAVACVRLGLSYLGSEISADQVAYARERITAETEKAEGDDAWML
jgi:DNA modification methylase